MANDLPSGTDDAAIPVTCLCEGDLDAWRQSAPPLDAGLAGTEFRARPGQAVIVPGPDG